MRTEWKLMYFLLLPTLFSPVPKVFFKVSSASTIKKQCQRGQLYIVEEKKKKAVVSSVSFSVL